MGLYIVVWFGFWILRYRVCNIDVCFMLDGAGGWRRMWFFLGDAVWCRMFQVLSFNVSDLLYRSQFHKALYIS